MTTLVEIASLINRTDPNSNAPIMMLSAGNGFIMQSDKYSRDNAGQSLKKYILLKQGELAYNHGASKAKHFGCCYELTEPEARIPYVYHCFKINDAEYTPYVALALNNAKMDRQLKRLVSSSVRMDGLLNISFEDYMSVTLYLPSYMEQKRTADFLKKLDERIALQERLLLSIKKYKRGLLSTIFSNITNCVPLKDICEYTSSAKTMSQIDSTPEGAYPVYDAGGVAAMVNFYDMENDYIAIIKDGSGVGRLQYCQAQSSFIGTLGGLIPKNCSTFYLYTALQTIDFKGYVTGMAIPHIYFKDYKNAVLPYPCEEKRAKIEAIFIKLDAKIAKAELLLSKFTELKKSLLQQLFI